MIAAVFGVKKEIHSRRFHPTGWHCRIGGMMEYLFVLNDPPYGTQRTYNALRLAGALAKGANSQVSIFLLGDGVVSGLRRQSPADASYNVQDMLRLLAAQGISIGACRTCLEARGIDDASLVAGINRRTLEDLSHWTEEATKVLVF
ncbi:MAG TPA: DsrE family protein [Candidatus Acidoferrales bacterium]|nr:DsrE family protein [Candidatus Acidoferrales bacterium]